MPRPPDWKLPPGVAPGTWDYAHSHRIAEDYGSFLADTPLARCDGQWLLDALPPAEPRRATLVVDLGCGNGRSALPLVAVGYRVLALDLSQAMLEQVAGPSEKPPAPILRVRANLAELEGFADGCVDHAICLFSTLGMIRGRKHRVACLRNARRMVRPGGRLVLHAHHRTAWLLHPGGLRRLLASRWRSWCGREEFGDFVYAYRNLADMFLHSFSARELRQELTAAGWSLQSCERLDITGTRKQSRWNPKPAGGFWVVAQNPQLK